jgi:hypothetical protein
MNIRNQLLQGWQVLVTDEYPQPALGWDSLSLAQGAAEAKGAQPGGHGVEGHRPPEQAVQ